MQHTVSAQTTSTVSSSLFASGTGNVPPQISYDFLDGVFDDYQFSSADDVLAPFDYNGFLAKEGLV